MRTKILFTLCLTILLASCGPQNVHTLGCNASELITAINDSNATPATTDTIILQSGCIYLLFDIDNSDSNGNNGLPMVTSPIVITGNGAAIQRNPGPGIPAFRIFFISAAGSLTIEDAYVQHGLAGPGDFMHGGAIYNQGSLTINGGTLTDNHASNGGAIYSVGGFNIANSTFSNNEGADTGGAISNTGNSTIIGSTFTGNQSPSGGAITNWDDLAISGSSFSGNQVNTSGGAIRNNHPGVLSVTTSTFSNNEARIGAAISNEYQLNIGTSTFSGNSATCLSMPVVCGTTILNYGASASTEINYSTIVNDSGAAPSAALVSKSGSILIRGAIVADNSDGDCGTYDGGSILTSDANLDSDGSCTASITASPVLGPLANNGGSTLTHALLPGSPAIDASPSSCPATDQRGVSRPQGSLCDLGSYEFDGEFTGPIWIATLNITPIVVTLFPIDTPTPTIGRIPPVGKILKEVLCWVGPGDPYDVISSIPPETQVELLGTGEGGGYLVILNPRYGVPCWTKEDDVDTGEVDLLSLPIFKIPPLPTPTPTTVPQVGCWVSSGQTTGGKCVVPCPDPKKYPQTCTP